MIFDNSKLKVTNDLKTHHNEKKEYRKCNGVQIHVDCFVVVKVDFRTHSKNNETGCDYPHHHRLNSVISFSTFSFAFFLFHVSVAFIMFSLSLF